MTSDTPTPESQLEIGGNDPAVDTSGIDRYASPAAKIKLFRSLFRGREDIYSQRFESRKTGKSGYQPACANEWVEGVCHKPRIKCSDCLNQRFLPVTDTVVQWHLSGQNDRGQPFVMGVYPMLRDESCYFVAADFDGSNWLQEANGFLTTCNRLEIPASLPPWNARARAKAATSGSSSKKQSPPSWPASWRPISSRKLWSNAQAWASAPMIASFRTRTRFRKVDLATSLRCRYRKRHGNTETASSSMK